MNERVKDGRTYVYNEYGDMLQMFPDALDVDTGKQIFIRDTGWYVQKIEAYVKIEDNKAINVNTFTVSSRP